MIARKRDVRHNSASRVSVETVGAKVESAPRSAGRDEAVSEV